MSSYFVLCCAFVVLSIPLLPSFVIFYKAPRNSAFWSFVYQSLPMVDSSYLNVHGNFFFFMFVCNLYYTFLSELQGNPSLGIELRTTMLFPKVV